MISLPWINVDNPQFLSLIGATNGTKMLIDTQRSNADAMANLWAAYHLCLAQEKPCGQCKSCHLLNIDTHPDSIFYTAPATIDKVRQILAQIHTTPTIAPIRTVYLGCIDQYNPHAINALLKTLEEPPTHSIFLLSTTSRRAVNPTVLSRSQCFNLAKPSHEQSLQWLVNSHQLSQQEAQQRLEIHANNPFAAIANKELPPVQESIDALITFLASPLDNPHYLMQLEQLPADAVLSFLTSQVLLLIKYLQCQEETKAMNTRALPKALNELNIVQLHTLYAKLASLRRPDQQQINPVLAIKSILLQAMKQRSLVT